MIYFVQNGEYVKIGYTQNTDVEKRIQQMETGNPKPFRMLKVIEGDVDDERRLHRQFSMSHIKKEWFIFSDEIREYLFNLNCNCRVDIGHYQSVLFAMYDQYLSFSLLWSLLVKKWEEGEKGFRNYLEYLHERLDNVSENEFEKRLADILRAQNKKHTKNKAKTKGGRK